LYPYGPSLPCVDSDASALKTVEIDRAERMTLPIRLPRHNCRRRLDSRGYIVETEAFVQLPTAVSPLGLGVAGFIVAWMVGLLLVLALVLWMHMHVQPDEAED